MKRVITLASMLVLVAGCGMTVSHNGSTTNSFATTSRTVAKCENSVGPYLTIARVSSAVGHESYEGVVKEITSKNTKDLNCVARTSGSKGFMCFTKPVRGIVTTYQPTTLAHDTKAVEVSVVNVGKLEGAKLEDFMKTLVTDGNDECYQIMCDQTAKGF